MIDDAVVLRAIERILAVAVGGLCIWLGQRLFLSIPEQKEGEGHVEFPGGISIYVARVGPGVFFALFGAILVGTSFYRGVEVQETHRVSVHESAPPTESGQSRSSALHSLEYRGAGASMAVSEPEARADQRALMRKDFQVLNTIPLWLRRDLPSQDRRRFEQSITQIKLAVMKTMWGDPGEGWGDSAQFERWINEGAHAPPPVAVKAAFDYFNQGPPP